MRVHSTTGVITEGIFDGNWKFAFVRSGTRYHAEVTEREYRGIVLPRADLGERVGAENERERCVRLACLDGANGVDRVGRTLALDLAKIEREVRIPGDRELEHAAAVLDGGLRALRLVRWHGGKHELDAVERQGLAHLERSAQVGEVDGIEGAAEEPDPCRQSLTAPLSLSALRARAQVRI